MLLQPITLLFSTGTLQPSVYTLSFYQILLFLLILGLLFFIDWITNIFTEDPGNGGRNRNKDKIHKVLLTFNKMVPMIFSNSKTAKIDSNNVINIRTIYGCIEVSMHFF